MRPPSRILDGFQVRKATDASEERLLADVDKFGWHVINIPQDDVGPAYCFSIGLYYSYGHPELMVSGLSVSAGHALINSAANLIASGTRFRHGERTSALVENCECKLIELSPALCREHLGFAIWFYKSLGKPFPALQIVWPDNKGRFPGESGVDERCKALQTLPAATLENTNQRWPSPLTIPLHSRSMSAIESNLCKLMERALAARRSLTDSGTTEAFRAFSGAADGMDGVFVDVYASGATLIVYEGRAPRSFDPAREANLLLESLSPLGVKAIYFKPFARDRSRLGGELPAVVLQAQPLAGVELPEAIVVREHRCSFEIRPYDGLSTGLFLDQRDNRAFVGDLVSRFKGDSPPSVLNTFAYTCAFSVAAGVAGARTTSVDVSARYLDWGKRNFAHNNIDVASSDAHRFARMDTFEFFAYARRKELRYDLIVLDPPSFGSGSKKRGIRAWSAESDYHRLVREATALLNRNGVILASTNTQALCRPGQLDREIIKALGRPPRWLDLPPVPIDFARDADRFAAKLFRP